eukprot:1010240_1
MSHDDAEENVSVYKYDLSKGKVKEILSNDVIKAVLDGAGVADVSAISGIWHTSLVVFGQEYYFGGGIHHADPGETAFGTDFCTDIPMGPTTKTETEFDDFLASDDIRERFKADNYDLLSHNCNTFTKEAIEFLETNEHFPSDITELP